MVIRFKSEEVEKVEALQAPRQCPKCPKTFTTPVGLHNHLKWHSEAVKDKLFTPLKLRDLPDVETKLSVNEETSEVKLTIIIEGLTCEAVRAARDEEVRVGEEQQDLRKQKKTPRGKPTTGCARKGGR